MYEYFYNGGGVAVGDLNNDGWEDVYFSGNMVDNKLYLNKGNLQFDDVTQTAGVGGRPGPWKTGATLVDLNADGRLDIYLCYSGKIGGKNRSPQLFINRGNNPQGQPEFADETAEYGLADSLFATQAYFFDFDRDGDLDLLQANHNPKRLESLDDARIAALLKKPDPQSGTRLLRNDNGHFTDITVRSGIVNTPLSYNLGAGIADLNNDGWPDIYLSNDYLVPDYLYINNGDGTFTDKLAGAINHTSQFSMGNDVADINNDGHPDIVTLDMLPAGNYRQKLLFAPDNYEEFNLYVRAGFHHQYMRNMLQLNNGDGTFSETGQLAGISNTDWSWAPLIADFDNDGLKDVFVTNGYLRDYTNMDFLKYMTDFLLQNRGQVYRQDLYDLVKKIPASNVVNYAFRNNGNSTFTNVQKAWGFTIPSNSNGAAYADLDNDGDLDLVMNNINQPAFIYQNNSKRGQHFLRIKIRGDAKNTQAIGTKVTLYAAGKKQYIEQMPARGFQSSVSPVLHFGLGQSTRIDSLVIIWPDQKTQRLSTVPADTTLQLNQSDASKEIFHKPKPPSPIFSRITPPLSYTAAPLRVNDFKRQALLLQPLSFSGPCMAPADINNDGMDDIFIGGGGGKAGAVFAQKKSGFDRIPQPALEKDAGREDGSAVFFDADGNGTIDLYVAGAGYSQFFPTDSLLQHRLYLNDGRGHFTKATNALPAIALSSICARVADVNGDGFPDLFVGGRVIPGRYPETPRSYLLVNDGKGHFTDRTKAFAPALQQPGMVTDAVFADINRDRKPDLIVVGEWMPITVFINRNGRFRDETLNYFSKRYSGWWNRILLKDLNGDGQPDLVAGNMGSNTQVRASQAQPAKMYVKDFDDNGSLDPILCFSMQGKSYPYVTRDELFEQISSMRSRFGSYREYAGATYESIFTADERKGAAELTANSQKTSYFQRDAKGRFVEKSLPPEAQYAPIFSITPLDYDADGDQDLLLCGNVRHARLRLGNSDANYGMLFQNDGKGRFRYVPQNQSGLSIRGDVRSVLYLKDFLLVGLNQSAVQALQLKRKK